MNLVEAFMKSEGRNFGFNYDQEQEFIEILKRADSILSKLPKTKDGYYLQEVDKVYCPRGHAQNSEEVNPLGTLYCTDDDGCWNDYMADGIGEGTAYKLSDCTAKPGQKASVTSEDT